MKKAVSLAFLFICIFFIYQFGVNFFKNSHELTYSIQKDNYSFKVKESFLKDHYNIEVEVREYDFYFQQENNFNKQKKIISDFEFKEENGLMCIYPVYTEIEDAYLLCSDNDKIYTKDSLNGNSMVQAFYNELVDKKYEEVLPIDETVKTYNRITYYPNAMNEYVALWYYQGFISFSNNSAVYRPFLSFDRYENTLSALIGKYYITPYYSSKKLFECSSFEVYDVSSNENFTIDLNTTLSNFSYKNGVVEDKLYIFDKNNMVQIAIDPKKKKSEIVGNKDINGLDYQGKWTTRNIYDFSQSIVKFSSFDETKLRERYSYINAVEDRNSYYFYDGEGLYQVYKQNLDKKILLLKQQNMKEIQVNDGFIYYILGDTIYKYNINTGIRKILQYSELQYNWENMYSIYKK